MKDIPMFTTEYGVASLFLQQIPYTGIARIEILASETPEALLEECVGFCKACGADQIHGCGHAYLEKFPMVTKILEMVGEKPEPSSAALFPVQAHTATQWRNLVNMRMSDVDGVAYITERDCAQMVKNGGAYFVHEGDTLLGVGLVEEDEIRMIASVARGRGEDVMRALSSVIPSEKVRVCVASTNLRAISLYERLGFIKTKIIKKWFEII